MYVKTMIKDMDNYYQLLENKIPACKQYLTGELNILPSNSALKEKVQEITSRFLPQNAALTEKPLG